MFRLSKLFKGIFSSVKCLSKKAYTCGLVVIASCAVTVLLLGTNNYLLGSRVVNNKTEIEKEEEDTVALESSVELEGLLNSSDENETLQITQISLEESKELKPDLQKDEDDEVVLTTAISKSAEQDYSKLLTEQDYTALVKIVEAEATGEDIIGKIMVANVVLNRVNSSRFPNSIYDVVHQKINGRAQFSPIDDGRYETVPLSKSTYEAVERALSGEDYSNGALFFVARSLTTEEAVSWFDNNLNKVAEYGVHEFYTYY